MTVNLETKVENYFLEHEKDRQDIKGLDDLKDEIRRKVCEVVIVQKEFADIEHRINVEGECDFLQTWWGKESQVLEKEFELTDLLETYDKMVGN